MALSNDIMLPIQYYHVALQKREQRPFSNNERNPQVTITTGCLSD
jgi:hypothetical protein